MKRNFAFTIGAIKEVCERCPDHDINRLMELFNETDFIKQLENMTWFICTLNKWAVYKDTGSFEGALTEEDLLKMEMPDINAMFDEAMVSFAGDSKSETEVEPVKKQKAVPSDKK